MIRATSYKKAQIEFIVIFVLVIVGAVVIMLSYSGVIDVGLGPANEQRTVKDSVINFIREGSQDVLRTLSEHGGYADVASFSNSERFLGKKAPYWQYSGQKLYPDLSSSFIRKLTEYIENNKGFLEASFEGKNITIGEPQVSANILNNKIDITVYMATTVQGVEIQQPYQVSIPTKIGEIYDFSKEFVDFSLNERFFEVATLNSMVVSPTDDGAHTTPFSIILLHCGDFLYKDWFDIKDGVEMEIKKTLAHVYMPGKVPLNTGDRISSAKYALPEFNGKDYSDLEVTFHLPDDFELNQNTLQFTPNPISAVAEPVPMSTLCQSNPIYVNYYITYPMVVVIKDTLTGNLFRFTSQVYIKDNEPGALTQIYGYESDFQEQLCNEQFCSGKINVVDSSGNPISDASINFMGCPLGKTNSNGLYNGPAPCGLGSLDIHKRDHGDFIEMIQSTELEDITVTLYKKPYLNLYFHEVVIQNVTFPTQQYWIEPRGVDYINTMHEDESAYLEFVNRFALDDVPEYFMFNSKTGAINQLPVRDYLIGGSLLVNGESMGMFMTDYQITEDMDMQDLHIYLPYMLGFNELDDNATIMEAGYILSKVLDECGYGPVTTQEVDITNLKVAEYDGENVTCS